MELRTYLSFPEVVVASLALILRHSDYQWLLTTHNRHSVFPLNGEVFEIKSGKRVFNAIVTGRINFLFLEKQAFSLEFSNTLALIKYGLLNAVVSE